MEIPKKIKKKGLKLRFFEFLRKMFFASASSNKDVIDGDNISHQSECMLQNFNANNDFGVVRSKTSGSLLWENAPENCIDKVCQPKADIESRTRGSSLGVCIEQTSATPESSLHIFIFTVEQNSGGPTSILSQYNYEGSSFHRLVLHDLDLDACPLFVGGRDVGGDIRKNQFCVSKGQRNGGLVWWGNAPLNSIGKVGQRNADSKSCTTGIFSLGVCDEQTSVAPFSSLHIFIFTVEQKSGGPTLLLSQCDNKRRWSYKPHHRGSIGKSLLTPLIFQATANCNSTGAVHWYPSASRHSSAVESSRANKAARACPYNLGDCAG